ncbi:hypothetical protein AAFC00_005253 [Neodothiora populina]|uniref:MYB transcription factor n=1 Tax=Neodothiora populina TaxID=2781224 RepID=A0ABR3PKB3_9PEZI
MDISSLLEGAPPKSPSPSNLSSTSQSSQNGRKRKLEPAFAPNEHSYKSLPRRFHPSSYSQSQYAPASQGSYHPQQTGFSHVPAMASHDRGPPLPSLQHSLGNGSLPPSKRLAAHSTNTGESPVKKKQSKWSPEEDAAIIELRGNGMKWEDISKHLTGRSAISCRLRFQNYLERRSEWDDEKKNKLARLYERFKKDMWEKIAKEMQLPWRAAEAMHWQIGEVEMASRANVPVFHLANPTSHSSSQHPPQPPPTQIYSYPTPASVAGTERGSTSVSPSGQNIQYHLQSTLPSTHNHTLPQMSNSISPGTCQARRNSASSTTDGDNRTRADSTRDTKHFPISSDYSQDSSRQYSNKRYLSPTGDRLAGFESS